MSVCRKHKKEGRRSCNCRVSASASYDGYGGPDFTDVTFTGFDNSAWGNDSGTAGGDGGGGGGGGE